MSCFDWESGSIKIPAHSWAALKSALSDAQNAQREEVRFWAASAIKQLESRYADDGGVRRLVMRGLTINDLGDCPEELSHSIYRVVSASIDEGGSCQFSGITEEMLSQHACSAATTETLTYKPLMGCRPGWVVALDDKTFTVTWEVEEGNHAVERARASRVGEALFRELGKIDFGSEEELGGVILGCDEYTENAGDGDYIAAAFGKAGECVRRERVAA